MLPCLKMKHHLLWLFVITLLLLFGLFRSCIVPSHSHSPGESRTVYIRKSESGFQLIRNGEPFYIKGAGGNMHLDVLSQIGGNTIRVYDTTHVAALLDEAHLNNLAVIIDIPLPQYNKTYKYYSNQERNKVLKQKVRALVRSHKDHPALLMWNLGNELYYPLVFRKNNFIRTYNDLIDIIHEEDPNHPVSTAMAGVGRISAASIFIHSPKLDLLAYNIFSDTPNLHSKLRQLSVLFGRRPYYISEFGSDGPWESGNTSWNAPIEHTSSKKVQQINKRYSIINNSKDDACLGSLAFYWGNKLERTYSWFSYFIDDHKSEIVAGLEALWNNLDVPVQNFNIRSMQIEGKPASENLIFAPNEMKVSELDMDNQGKTVEIKWEVYKEAWPWGWTSRQDSSFKLFNPKKVVDTSMECNGTSVSFITPQEEGPYRIFAFVYDQEGYFATANVPFYILAKNEN